MEKIIKISWDENKFPKIDNEIIAKMLVEANCKSIEFEPIQVNADKINIRQEINGGLIFHPLFKKIDRILQGTMHNSQIEDFKEIKELLDKIYDNIDKIGVENRTMKSSLRGLRSILRDLDLEGDKY
jgi:mevalonate kinase